MSALGDYVHYDWYTYKQSGTHKMNSGGYNFNEDIFAMHSQLLYKQIESLKIPNLIDIEKEYNLERQRGYDDLVKLQKEDPTKFKNIMSIFISSLGENYENNVDYFLENISLDEKDWVPRFGKNVKIKNLDIGAPPQVNFGSDFKTGYQSSSRYQSAPRIVFCKDMIKYIQKATDEQSNLDINLLLLWKKALENNRASNIKKRKLTDKVINKKGKEVDRIVNDLSPQHARSFDMYASRLRAAYYSAYQINEKLSEAWAEFLGNSIQYSFSQASNIAIKAMTEVGKTYTSSGKGQIATIKFDDSEVKSWIEEKNAKAKADFYSNSKNKNKKFKEPYTELFADFSTIGDETWQKADIEVTLSGDFYGISMKNTNFQARGSIEDDFFTIPQIHLQNSSLMLYLLDIQKNYENWGTHYLNIFADKSKTKTDNLYIKMRIEANDALTLHILLASLTGSGQLREGGRANILAIEDKNSKLKSGEYRVKFFDIPTIISNYFNNSRGWSESGSIYRQIENIELNNTWNPNENGELARITRLMLEARKYSINARLLTEYLRNIYHGIY